MAPTQLLLRVLRAKGQFCVFLLLLQSPQAYGMSGWGRCLDGEDVFAAVRENSPPVILFPELFGDWGDDSFSWIVRGKDAHWFFLDGTNLWLNTSKEKVLDREIQGQILLAELACYEEDTLQTVYRIVVEILNENDNIPVFVDGPVQTAVISELTPVNAVVFEVQAADADNDIIVYNIDQASPDAKYFKLVLPNSGEIALAKPLDYETKTLLSVVVHATEMDTAEQYSTSAQVTVTVQDGDDQYPLFMPCTVLYEDVSAHVCLSPTYTANVTEGQQDIVLSFSPGPIFAVDGDSGLSSSISYAILTGNDDGHFLIDRHTGEISLTQGVPDRLVTPAFHLQVMAFQDNDQRKYSVAAVVVHILGHNQFPPVFEKSQYSGFVMMGLGAVALVHTYGNRELVLTVIDQDFNQSVNPMIVFSISPVSNHSKLYTVTKEGLVIVKTGQLSPREKHILEVRAEDQDSGEFAFTTVTVEVLAEGQAAPQSEVSGQRLSGCVVGKAFFLCLVALSLGLSLLYLCVWMKKRLQDHGDPPERGSVAQGKHPNVSLRWFQLVSHGSAMPQMEDLPFNAEDYGTSNPSFVFSNQDSPSQPEPSTSNDNPKATGREQTTSQDTENLSLETLPCDSPLRPLENLSIPKTLAASAIDKPTCKVLSATIRTSSPLLCAQQGSTPPPSPELLSWSSLRQSPFTGAEVEAEPSTSLDNSDHSSAGARREEEEGSVSPDLLPDELELLEVMERCYPVMVTFRK